MNENTYLNKYIQDISTDGTDQCGFGVRVNASLRFLETLQEIASHDIPVLERANFLWISISNFMEIMGKTYNDASDRKMSDMVNLMIHFFAQVNKIADTIDYSKCKYDDKIISSISHPKIRKGLKPGFDPKTDNALVKSNIHYDFYHRKSLNEGYDGWKIIPITLFRDFSTGFKRNDLGVWCLEEMRKDVIEIKKHKMKFALVWVRPNLTKSERKTVASMVEGIGYIPFFMNVNLYNAHCRYNSYDNPDQTGVRYPNTQKYEEFDYLQTDEYRRYIRVPFHSYKEVDDLYTQAVDDPDTLAIFLCLYRPTENSTLINNMIRATHKKIRVYCYIEMNAIGNEVANMDTINQLTREANPEYLALQFSYMGLKVHAKTGLVVMKNGGICHQATGNFNETTGNIYTDIHRISNQIDDINEVMTVFMALMSQEPYICPIKKDLIDEICAEIEKGPEGKIAIKCNHMLDDGVIDLLNLAAMNGVAVKCIVRSTPKISRGNTGTEITQVVGKYLEHERIFAFGDLDDLRVYASSADLLFRNLYSRMEVVFRIDEEEPEMAANLAMEIWMNDFI